MTNGRDILRVVSRRIRIRRVELDVTQEELATRSGCHVNYISKVERGNLDPGLKKLNKIAISLEMSLSDLVS